MSIPVLNKVKTLSEKDSLIATNDDYIETDLERPQKAHNTQKQENIITKKVPKQVKKVKQEEKLEMKVKKGKVNKETITKPLFKHFLVTGVDKDSLANIPQND